VKTAVFSPCGVLSTNQFIQCFFNNAKRLIMKSILCKQKICSLLARILREYQLFACANRLCIKKVCSYQQWALIYEILCKAMSCLKWEIACKLTSDDWSSLSINCWVYLISLRIASPTFIILIRHNGRMYSPNFKSNPHLYLERAGLVESYR
jgi:hypothetical protein